MPKPKGRTPSLIGSSLGRPAVANCGRRTPCSRCGADILKGDTCYDVPQPRKLHSATRRFCGECFGRVLKQTRDDLDNLERSASQTT